MKKIRFVKERSDAQWIFKMNDGRMIEIMNLKGEMVIRYDTPFELNTGIIYPKGSKVPKGVKLITLNDLAEAKMGDTIYIYDEYEVMVGYPRTMSEKRIERICNKFRKNGFNVTPDAIKHNYHAWLGDLKSGYRDEQNGYHLFSPCGCNALRFSATNLLPCLDWQTNYVW